MKNTHVLVLVSVAFLFISIGATRAAETELWRNGISLIPYPRTVEMGGEDFVFNKKIDILVDRGANP